MIRSLSNISAFLGQRSGIKLSRPSGSNSVIRHTDPSAENSTTDWAMTAPSVYRSRCVPTISRIGTRRSVGVAEWETKQGQYSSCRLRTGTRGREARQARQPKRPLALPGLVKAVPTRRVGSPFPVPRRDALRRTSALVEAFSLSDHGSGCAARTEVGPSALDRCTP